MICHSFFVCVFTKKHDIVDGRNNYRGEMQVATTLKGPFRADHVGSFLRPESLKQARTDFAANKITKEQLRDIENTCIIDLINKQKAAGMTGVTDGEFRRKYWHYDFIEQLDGIQGYEEEAPGFFQGEMTKLHKYVVNGKLSFPKDHPFLADFDFVKTHAGNDAVAKQTIPGPNMIFHSGVIANPLYKENPAYGSLADVAKAISALYQDIIQTFYDRGCRYLQLDDTSWGAFFSEKFRSTMTDNNHDPKQLMEIFANITIDALANKPEDMTVTMHICRGNFKSAWLYEGDYEAVAEQLFARVNIDAFFLEFDNERAGGFEPLRMIGKQTVVLGLITSKSGELEDPETVKTRIKEASQYVPLDQLALSPQCGFASTEEGNLLQEVDQWKKLQLVKSIADDIWHA